MIELSKADASKLILSFLGKYKSMGEYLRNDPGALRSQALLHKEYEEIKSYMALEAKQPPSTRRAK